MIILVILMKIYIDLVLLLNFFFDLLLLFSVAVLLRRQTDLKHLVLGALVGSITIFSMFIEMDSVSIFFLKILISILMVIIAFGFSSKKAFFRNLFYLYTSSILLGGFLYFLNLQFSYQNEGLVFYFKGLSVNVVALIALGPIILYCYVKQGLHLKNHYHHYYSVNIYLRSGEVIEATAFLDTGNHLVDPYKRRPIILINKGRIEVDYEKNPMVLVPYDALNYHGLLKCIIPDKIFIQGVGFRENFLLGITEEKIRLDGVDCIMGGNLLEHLNVL